MGIEIQPPGPGTIPAPTGSLAIFGTVTGPAANGVVAAISTPPAGLYQITVQPELSGTITAAEQDNFKLNANAVLVSRICSQALPTTGLVQAPFSCVVQINGTNNVNVEANTAAGAAAVYSATITMTRVG